MNKTETEVWNTVRELNRCWTCGDPAELDKLADYFHDEMVAITTTNRFRLEGKEACLRGWQGFARSVKIHSWKETDPKVQIFGNTAVVTYYFDMAFGLAGQTIHMEGRDMFTLIKENNKWLVIADQFSQYPQ